MLPCGVWVQKMEEGQFDALLRALYADDDAVVLRQRTRYVAALRAFEAEFGAGRNVGIYSVPGRTEIGGNHTDHNHGMVLAAAVNLDLIAVVGKNTDNTVRVRSEGFAGVDTVWLDDLEPENSEFGFSSALVRGVAAAIKQQGGTVGGFDAYTTSDVLVGSGLSSSAAFEVCMACIFNEEYNAGRFSPVQLGLMGQMAENVFFGKPSGLMDQVTCAVGGAITIDLASPDSPVVEKIPFDLGKHAFSLVITGTGEDHAGLTEDYAAIRSEMQGVAGFFGKRVLREVEYGMFLDCIAEVRAAVGDRAVLRALHFYDECDRVLAMAQALTREDIQAFLQLVLEAGHSAFEYNQNAYSIRYPNRQAVPLALALSQSVLEGKGAWRLQGGGFAGAIQAFVPNALLEPYCGLMERVFGEGAARVLGVRSAGCLNVEKALF